MLIEIKTDTLHYFEDENGRQGEYKCWHDNGQLYEHYFYENGELTGEYKKWYFNGQIEAQGLCNGSQGEFKIYHNNGQLCSHYFQENGNLHGEYKYWSRDGQLETHGFYENNNDITNQIKALVKDINNITSEEKFLIKLHYGIPILC